MRLGSSGKLFSLEYTVALLPFQFQFLLHCEGRSSPVVEHGTWCVVCCTEDSRKMSQTRSEEPSVASICRNPESYPVHSSNSLVLEVSRWRFPQNLEEFPKLSWSLYIQWKCYMGNSIDFMDHIWAFLLSHFRVLTHKFPIVKMEQNLICYI